MAQVSLLQLSKQAADLSLRFRDTLLWTSLGLAVSAGIKPGCSSLPTFSCTGYPDNNAAADSVEAQNSVAAMAAVTTKKTVVEA